MQACQDCVSTSASTETGGEIFDAIERLFVELCHLILARTIPLDNLFTVLEMGKEGSLSALAFCPLADKELLKLRQVIAARGVDDKLSVYKVI